MNQNIAKSSALLLSTGHQFSHQTKRAACSGCSLQENHFRSYVWNNLSQTESFELSRFQRCVAKQIQGFFMRTRTDICESMLGIHPVSSKMIIRKILFLHKRLSLPSDSVSQQILFKKAEIVLDEHSNDYKRVCTG